MKHNYHLDLFPSIKDSRAYKSLPQDGTLHSMRDNFQPDHTFSIDHRWEHSLCLSWSSGGSSGDRLGCTNPMFDTLHPLAHDPPQTDTLHHWYSIPHSNLCSLPIHHGWGNHRKQEHSLQQSWPICPSKPNRSHYSSPMSGIQHQQGSLPIPINTPQTPAHTHHSTLYTTQRHQKSHSYRREAYKIALPWSTSPSSSNTPDSPNPMCGTQYPRARWFLTAHINHFWVHSLYSRQCRSQINHTDHRNQKREHTHSQSSPIEGNMQGRSDCTSPKIGTPVGWVGRFREIAYIHHPPTHIHHNIPSIGLTDQTSHSSWKSVCSHYQSSSI